MPGSTLAAWQLIRPATQTDDGPSRLGASVGQLVDLVGGRSEHPRQLPRLLRRDRISGAKLVNHNLAFDRAVKLLGARDVHVDVLGTR